MMRSGLFAVLACLLWGASAACTTTSDASVPELAPSAEQGEAPAAPSEASPVAQAAPGADEAEGPRYPALRFEMLPEEAQGRFIELASAELCPCEGAVASLDACLKQEQVCELGIQVAALMMQLTVTGMDAVEITDTVQSYLENMRRVHTFELGDTPYQGAEEPEVVVVEFSDFECPHCARLSAMWSGILEDLGDRVRVYHKQFPLASHPNAAAAAVAALAAHRQGHFVAFHDMVFENQMLLQGTSDPTPLFMQWAEACGLNLERFEADMNDPAVAAQVARDRAEGMAANIQSTPTLFLDGVLMLDAFSEDAIRAKIEAALN